MTKILTNNIELYGLENARRKNLSENDFYIQKADIVLNVKGDKQKFIGSFKYKKPGIWLISFKGNTGIEAARAWITADTILLNDRLHNKLYYGRSDVIEEKYGIPVIALPVLFGDFIESGKMAKDSIQCINGKYEHIEKFERFITKYQISCGENKVINAKILYHNRDEIIFKYLKTSIIGDKEFPSRILVKDQGNNLTIEIVIKKVDFNKIENINFIPGKGYERILLK